MCHILKYAQIKSNQIEWIFLSITLQHVFWCAIYTIAATELPRWTLQVFHTESRPVETDSPSKHEFVRMIFRQLQYSSARLLLDPGLTFVNCFSGTSAFARSFAQEDM